MSEILPYLGIQREYADESLAGADTTVPNCVGSTLEEAKSKLEAAGFTCKTVGSAATVTDQTPVGGAIVPGSATVILYMGEKKPDTLCTVPDVVHMSASAANQAMHGTGLEACWWWEPPR